MAIQKKGYTNFLKGDIAASVIKRLLLDADYKVIPFGVENVIREISSLDPDEYKEVMECLEVVRYMPDFFVLDTEKKSGKLVEVKYRTELNDNTEAKLLKSVENYKSWVPASLVLVVGKELPKWGAGVGKHIRVFEINSTVLENIHTSHDYFSSGESGKRIQDYFPNLDSRYEDKTIQKAAEAIISAMGALDDRV